VCLLRGTFCPHSVFMFFMWIWEQTAIISLYSINWLVFITEIECVYCEVRNGSLNLIHVNGFYLFISFLSIYIFVPLRDAFFLSWYLSASLNASVSGNGSNWADNICWLNHTAATKRMLTFRNDKSPSYAWSKLPKRRIHNVLQKHYFGVGTEMFWKTLEN
jgi:hypothetical protein